MKISEVVSRLQLGVAAGNEQLGRDIDSGYVSDLLSNVMGHAGAGAVWVTMQAHQNIVAVASLTDLAAIIIADGIMPDPHTLAKAESEGIVILTTPLSGYEVVGRLYGLGITGP
ncbi:hypothetical protein SDC9_09054 [bioreactor metagenome]|uniref:DRTGG domain-containing protein n=1 Tax=bioreactor metagenome TaxID=1076179 RepID=A0A644TAB4_9ZZZZ|nr:DRTGG domain-containing protein [Negativicutes bacterium]